MGKFTGRPEVRNNIDSNNLSCLRSLTDKPMLRDNAVPCKNLPQRGEPPKIEILSQRIISTKRKPREKLIDSSEAKKVKEETAEFIVIPEATESVKIISNEILLEAISEEHHKSGEISREIELEPENHKEMLEAFENLYDEAFDVTLPSLLWGIHRDPDRKFIVFSKFNQSSMSCSKIVHIADTFHCKNFNNNILERSTALQMENLSVEYVSSMLDELDSASL